MSYRAAHELGILWTRTVDQISATEHALRACELSSGAGHNVRRMNRLRKEIDKLEARLKRIEAAQDMEIRKGDD